MHKSVQRDPELAKRRTELVAIHPQRWLFSFRQSIMKPLETSRTDIREQCASCVGWQEVGDVGLAKQRWKDG